MSHLTKSGSSGAKGGIKKKLDKKKKPQSDEESEDFAESDSDVSESDHDVPTSDEDDFESKDDKKTANKSSNKSTPQVKVGTKRKNVIQDDEDDDDDLGSHKTNEMQAPSSGHMNHNDVIDISSPPSAKKNKNRPSVGVAAVKSSCPPSSSALASSISAPLSASTTAGKSINVDITKGGDVGSLGQATKLIEQYFKQQNRPYNAQQIYDNFHMRISKGLIEQTLNDRNLPKIGVRCKLFGKTKIYYPDQSNLPSNTSEQQLKQMERDIQELAQRLAEAREVEKEETRAYRVLLSEPTDDDIDAQLEALEKRVAEKNERSSKISSVNVNPQGMSDAILQHNFYRKEWASRKRTAMDLINDISAGMERKPKDVLMDMGIETDEEAGVTVPAPLPELLR